jgi:hypothetical protein
LRAANLEILYGNTRVYAYFLSLKAVRRNKKNSILELRDGN